MKTSPIYGLYGKRKTTRIGKPQNPAQKRASIENFALFQLTGAKGNLANVRASLKVIGDTGADCLLHYSLKYIENAITHIKMVQAGRKAKP